MSQFPELDDDLAQVIDDLKRRIRALENISGNLEVTWTPDGVCLVAPEAIAPSMVADPVMVCGASVTELRDDYTDGAWNSFVSASNYFIGHVKANPCNLDGTEIIATTTLYLKATALPGVASMGYERIAVGDVIGWVPGDGTEAVHGTSAPVKYYDGYIYPNAGLNGAVMTARVAPPPL